MTTYVVMTRRECRDQGKTAIEAASNLSGITIKSSDNPDLILIESPSSVKQLRAELGDSFIIERNITYKPLTD